jgi:hypothetical protein
MKAIGLNIVFILFTFLTWSQKASVQLTVDPEEIGINQIVTVTIKANVEGDVVENWPSNFVKNYGIQSMSQYVQDINTGKMMQEHVLVFTGTFNKSGKYKFGPFYVKAGNKTYTSNTVKVNVIDNPTQNSPEDLTRQQLRQPAFGVIEVSSTKIYEGEPLIISGRVYSKERTYGRPVLRRPFEVDGVNDVYPMQQSESWETLTIKGKNYESFSFEKKVMFPVGSGIINIQPFEVYLPYRTNGFNVLSSVPTVEIVPLPANAPTEFIGAVGDFEVEQKVDTKKTKQGDIVQVNVVVSGKGNLHAIEAPVLPLPKGMNTYGDAEVKEDYIFNSQGAVGKVTYTYYVQVTKEGEQTIKPVKIAYFNPKEEKYVSIEAPKAIKITVAGDPSFKIETDTTETNTFADAKKLDNQDNKKVFLKENQWVWYGIGGTILLAGILLFIVFKPKSKQTQETKLAHKKETSNTVKSISQNDAKALINQTAFYLKEKQEDQFYASMEKSLAAIIKLKLKLPANSSNLRVELIEKLKQEDHSSVATIQRLFEKCDYARYGMIASEEEQEELMKELERLI